MTTGFIAGPGIALQSIAIEKSELRNYLKRYFGKITKSAARAMEVCPPKQNIRVVCLCHTEFLAPAWTSLRIQAGQDPGSLSLNWKPVSEGGSGRWITSETPGSGLVIRSGFGNYDVSFPI
jgi:hypothetical protein